MKRKIGIIGAGWLGIRTATALQQDYTIYTTTTSVEKLEFLSNLGFPPTLVHFSNEVNINPIPKWEITNELDTIFCTIHIADRKSSTEEIKNRITNLADFIGDFKGLLIFTSSTSIYPSIDQDHKEDDYPIEQVAGEKLIRQYYPQATILRLAGLMGDERLLRKYNPTQLDQPVNHIHYTDIAQLVALLIDKQITHELFNVAAPLHPSKAAVIAAQKEEIQPSQPFTEGRTINTNKLQTQLQFNFLYPDPRTFHLTLS